MDNKTILMIVVAIVLGMLVANMFKDVCGCKVVEGQCFQSNAPVNATATNCQWADSQDADCLSVLTAINAHPDITTTDSWCNGQVGGNTLCCDWSPPPPIAGGSTPPPPPPPAASGRTISFVDGCLEVTGAASSVGGVSSDHDGGSPSPCPSTSTCANPTTNHASDDTLWSYTTSVGGSVRTGTHSCQSHVYNLAGQAQFTFACDLCETGMDGTWDSDRDGDFCSKCCLDGPSSAGGGGGH